MIVYKIYKDHEEQQTGRKENWSTSDIVDAYNCESWNAPDEVFSSESLEEAKAEFESLKESCWTNYSKSFIGMWLLEADVLTLEEAEIDEDGEFIQGSYIDQYAEPFELEEEEEEEEE